MIEKLTLPLLVLYNNTNILTINFIHLIKIKYILESFFSLIKKLK